MVKLTTATKTAFISSYLPRRCGIATFTSDLIAHVRRAGGSDFEPEVIAMQSDASVEYGEPVRLIIRRDVQFDYISAADYINRSAVDVVSVQHEFGLFGGDAGSYLGILLGRLKKPVVTTLHTVLEKPSADYYNSLVDVCESSGKVIVMNKRGVRMLCEIYGVPRKKIVLIPHGIPDLPFDNGEVHKERLGLSGRKVILTFGLLGRNKGIETMLQAMKGIVGADPSVLYVVLGATHPEILKHEGESYKTGLEKMVESLGLQDNVVFHNRFVSDAELGEFLGAADIYVTPYVNKEQLTSGTLAFAVGAGKAVVSTPYWAALELLAGGRGRLVRFNEPEHLSRTIVEILGDDRLFNSLRKAAYDYGRSRTWAKVGRIYWNMFVQAAAQVPHGATVCRPYARPASVWKPAVYLPA